MPLKLRYPFYGSIHWYVLQKYADALSQLVKGAGGRKGGSSQGEVADKVPADSSGGQWLKQISMKRVCVLSGSQDRTAESCQDTSSLQDTPSTLQDTLSTLQDIPSTLQDTLSTLQDTPSTLQDTVVSLQDTFTTPQDIHQDVSLRGIIPKDISLSPPQATSTITSQNGPDSPQDTTIASQDRFSSSQDRLSSSQDTLAIVPQDILTNNSSEDMSTDLQADCISASVEDSPPLTDTQPPAPKPHFSSYERGGLLLLIHRMKNTLFDKDIPPSFSSPLELITELEQLLQSSMSQALCSLEPSGVGVLSRGRPSSSKHTIPPPSKTSRRKRTGTAVTPDARQLPRLAETSQSDTKVSTHETAASTETDSSPVNTTTNTVTPTCTTSVRNFQPILSAAKPICLHLTAASSPHAVMATFPPHMIQLFRVPQSPRVLVTPLTPQGNLLAMETHAAVLSASPAALLEEEVTIVRAANPAFSS